MTKFNKLILKFLVTNSWSCIEVEGFIPPARDGHSAVVYKDQMIVFAGFEEDNQRFSQETYAYNFTANQWTELKTEGTPPKHRDFHAACIFKSKMYVFGGRSDERGQYHSSVDYYDNAIHVLDLETLTWSTPTTTGTIPAGRRSNTLCKLISRIFIFVFRVVWRKCLCVWWL